MNQVLEDVCHLSSNYAHSSISNAEKLQVASSIKTALGLRNHGYQLDIETSNLPVTRKIISLLYPWMTSNY